MHIITINKKGGMNVKENKEGLWEGLDRGKGKEKGCDYIMT